MKRLFTLATMSAIALAIPMSGFAAAKKEAAAPAAETKKAPAKPAATPAPPKTMPMYSRVDTIDAASTSFTHKNADGKEIKFTVTATTDIKNGDAPAKFEDIKVGDTVSGSRIKKSETEYEVVKITKFGVVAPKTKPEKKEAAPKKEN